MWISGSGGQPVHHQIDRLLEGALLRLERDPAVGVHGPEGVERGFAVGTGQPGLQDAEQVVHAVVQRKRIALYVEEEVARARRGQARQAAVRLEAAVAQAGRRQQLVDRAAGFLAADLDGGLIASGPDHSAPRRRRVAPAAAAASAARPRRVETPASLRALRSRARRTGDERQVVVPAALGRADEAPAADLAMLHRARGTCRAAGRRRQVRSRLAGAGGRARAVRAACPGRPPRPAPRRPP